MLAWYIHRWLKMQLLIGIEINYYNYYYYYYYCHYYYYHYHYYYYHYYYACTIYTSVIKVAIAPWHWNDLLLLSIIIITNIHYIIIYLYIGHWIENIIVSTSDIHVINNSTQSHSYLFRELICIPSRMNIRMSECFFVICTFPWPHI